MSVGGLGGGKGIVTDGLVFSIDPYNSKSYSDSDTRIYDLTTSAQYASLKQGERGTFSGSGGNELPKFLYLQSSLSDWVDLGDGGEIQGNLANIIRGYTQFTCDFWLRKTDNNSNFIIGDYNGSNGWWCQWGSGANNTLYVGIDNNSNSLVLPTFENRWYHFTSVWNLDAGTNVDKGKLYVDGVLQTTTTNNLSNSSIPAGSRKFVIGSVQGTGTFYNGYISAVKIYDKILTPAEVSQNYNALKWRFR